MQHALPALFTLVKRGELALHDLVRKVCHAPAIRFGVQERGFLREGYWADLALVDTAKVLEARDEDVLYSCGWSPFRGIALDARIDSTWVNGRRVWDGRTLAPTIAGARLAFDAGR